MKAAIPALFIPVIFAGCAESNAQRNARLDRMAELRKSPEYQEHLKAKWRVLPGDQAPDFTLPNLENRETFTLADHRGKVVVINFFAEWCSPCRKEMREFKADLWPEFKDHPNVLLASISIDDKPTKAKRLVAGEGFQWTFLHDDGAKLVEQFTKGGGIPRCAVIDQKGRIAAVHSGYFEGVGALTAREVRELLETEKVASSSRE